jgi:hypothetical protein
VPPPAKTDLWGSGFRLGKSGLPIARGRIAIYRKTLPFRWEARARGDSLYFGVPPPPPSTTLPLPPPSPPTTTADAIYPTEKYEARRSCSQSVASRGFFSLSFVFNVTSSWPECGGLHFFFSLSISLLFSLVFLAFLAFVVHSASIVTQVSVSAAPISYQLPFYAFAKITDQGPLQYIPSLLFRPMPILNYGRAFEKLAVY